MPMMHNLCKIRGIIYSFGIALLLFPLWVGAQWVNPTDPNSPLAETGLSGSPISLVIIVFMRWLLYVVGFLAVIAFVISGVMYLTSAGNDDQIKKAKNTMIYAIIGVIVALSGLIIIRAVDRLLFTVTAQF